jgi:hypothetical protein
MVARCVCGLYWNISIKTELSEPYECPFCEAKKMRVPIKPKLTVTSKKKNKNEGRISNVLQRNRNKFSINNQ